MASLYQYFLKKFSRQWFVYTAAIFQLLILLSSLTRQYLIEMQLETR